MTQIEACKTGKTAKCYVALDNADDELKPTLKELYKTKTGKDLEYLITDKKD